MKARQEITGLRALLDDPTAELRAQLLAAALDAGADGVLVPHIRSADDARAAVAASRFPPGGIRSVHGAVRAASYGAARDQLRDSNARVAVMVMCEDVQALEVIDDIVAVEGVDAIFVGTSDLAASMGFPGQPGHPAVAAATRRVFAAAKRAGIAATLMAPAAHEAGDWFAAGARLVTLDLDTKALLTGVAAVIEVSRRDAH